jgi:shikimate dehydrogenase
MTYGLLGYKIGYSLSPVIHKLIACADLDYHLFDYAPEELESALSGPMAGLSGFNVTIPYKERIMQYCDILEESAEKIGAVNTIDIKDGLRTGYNTDYTGFIRVIKENIPDYLSYHPMILGYGGAARAVIFALETLGFFSASVLGGENKHDRKTFTCAVAPLLRLQVSDMNPDIPRLWINCTPVGSVKVPEVPVDFIKFGKEDILCDLNYSPCPTHLEQIAQKMGIKTINGLQMLIYQAVGAQKIWMGEDAPSEVNIQAIKQAIKS